MNKVKEIGQFFVDTYKKWLDDRAMRMAAALSYYTLFSLAPLLFILTSVLGRVAQSFLIRISVSVETGDLLESILGPDLTSFVLELVDSTSQSPAVTSSLPLISIIGLIITLWGASNIFTYLHEALNTIWGVQPIAKGGVFMQVRRRMLAFLIVFIAGFLLVFYLLANTVVSLLVPLISSHVPEALEIFPDVRVIQFSQFIVLFLVTTLLFAAFYRVLPDVEITWRDVFIGAAFTSVLFGVGMLLLSVYFHFYTSTFAGAAGSLIVLLLWFYYSSQIFMYGAEFTYMYATRYGSKIKPANYTAAVNKTLISGEESQDEALETPPDDGPTAEGPTGDSAPTDGVDEEPAT